MKPVDFVAWRAELGLSQRAAAAALDISHAMVKLYERGADYERRDADGEFKKIVIPRTVELACLCLLEHGFNGVPPIGAELRVRASKKR